MTVLPDRAPPGVDLAAAAHADATADVAVGVSSGITADPATVLVAAVAAIDAAAVLRERATALSAVAERGYGDRPGTVAAAARDALGHLADVLEDDADRLGAAAAAYRRADTAAPSHGPLP